VKNFEKSNLLLQSKLGPDAIDAIVATLAV
jgi:hypothetical protein